MSLGVIAPVTVIPGPVRTNGASDQQMIQHVVNTIEQRQQDYDASRYPGAYEDMRQAERSADQARQEEISRQGRRAAWDLVDSFNPITPFFTGSSRWYNGEHNLENGIKIASPVLGYGLGKGLEKLSPYVSPLITKLSQKTGFGLSGGYGPTRASEMVIVRGATTEGTVIGKITSPNSAMRASANSSGTYVNPLTGQVVPANGTLAADHIIAKSWIERQPGFSSLSRADKSAILNDPLNTQGLPTTFNASKGAKQPGTWVTYKGQPLDAGYVANDARRAADLQQYIRQQIKIRGSR